MHRTSTKKTLALLTPAAMIVLPLLGAAPAGAATSSTSYQAELNALNHSSASGTLMLYLSGDKATITEDVTGLAAKFSGAAYPHVQHIHVDAKGDCPDTSADTNGDGVISTTEGAPFYGGIGTTLSVSGDTSPAAGANIKIAPSGSHYHYSRTITLSADTVASIKADTAVIVVHGLDPSTLSAKAQKEKSDLVPALPLAATSPALCGALTEMPAGGADTGGGGTSGVQNGWLFGVAGAALLAAGALTARRRTNASR